MINMPNITNNKSKTCKTCQEMSTMPHVNNMKCQMSNVKNAKCQMSTMSKTNTPSWGHAGFIIFTCFGKDMAYAGWTAP